MTVAALVSVAVFVSYLLFYTAYSKQDKNLQVGLLVKVVTCRDGLDASLVELNKAISLAGLTVLAFAFILPPWLNSEASEGASLALQKKMCWHAFVMLELHACYSSIKFYGSKHIPDLSDWKRSSFASDMRQKKTFMTGVKKLSIILGAAGQIALIVGCFELMHNFMRLTFFLSVALGTAHFYSMEIDFKGKLQVRPFAFLPFPLAAIALFKLVW